MRRPSSLAEVAQWSAEHAQFHLNLADFVDECRRVRDPGALAEEPELLRERFDLGLGEVADAYLGAVAVSLARELGVDPPRWAWGPTRRLRRPWFAHPGPALRATLLAESPAAFRERNLFVSANALSRA